MPKPNILDPLGILPDGGKQKSIIFKYLVHLFGPWRALEIWQTEKGGKEMEYERR